MHWPWQSATTNAPASAPAQDDRQSPAGWAFFPPIQRIVGEQPTLTRTDAFTRSLPAWGNPSFMGAMTHLVSSDGPSGVVDADGGGLGAPRLTAYTPELPLLSQRSPTSASQTHDSVNADAEVEPSAVQRAVAESTVAGDQDQGTPELRLSRAAAPTESIDGRGPTLAAEPDDTSVPTGRSGADPRFNENATNDGNATIVSLPTARPLQRQTDEPVTRPMVGEPGQRRLGLGRPFVPEAHSLTARPAAAVARVADDSLPLAPGTTSAAVGSPDAAAAPGDDGSTQDTSASAPSAASADSPASSAGGQLVASEWAPGPRSMPVLPIATNATGLLSTQRLVTAGLERSLASRASSSSASGPSASSRSASRAPRSDSVVQRATVLAPGVSVSEGHTSPSSTDQSDEAPQAWAAVARPVWATQSAPTSTAPTAVVQRDFGGLPLGIPKESGIRDAVSSAESKAKSEITGDLSRAENTLKPAENAVAELARTATPGSVAAGSDASSAQDVDALAEKLMIPLLRRFKSEMLLDRERRGLRTDAF